MFCLLYYPHILTHPYKVVKHFFSADGFFIYIIMYRPLFKNFVSFSKKVLTRKTVCDIFNL